MTSSQAKLDEDAMVTFLAARQAPFYIQAVSWSPDDSTVYLGTTGYHPYVQSPGNGPWTGLCDAATAFPATQTSVLHKWVNYTGCDSLYSTGPTSAATSGSP